MRTAQEIRETYHELDCLKELLVSYQLDPDEVWERLDEMDISDRQFRQFVGVPYEDIRRLADYLNSEFSVLDIGQPEVFRQHGWLPDADAPAAPLRVLEMWRRLEDSGVAFSRPVASDWRFVIPAPDPPDRPYLALRWDEYMAYLRHRVAVGANEKGWVEAGFRVARHTEQKEETAMGNNHTGAILSASITKEDDRVDPFVLTQRIDTFRRVRVVENGITYMRFEDTFPDECEIDPEAVDLTTLRLAVVPTGDHVTHSVGYALFKVDDGDDHLLHVGDPSDRFGEVHCDGCLFAAGVWLIRLRPEQDLNAEAVAIARDLGEKVEKITGSCMWASEILGQLDISNGHAPAVLDRLTAKLAEAAEDVCAAQVTVDSLRAAIGQGESREIG